MLLKQRQNFSSDTRAASGGTHTHATEGGCPEQQNIIPAAKQRQAYMLLQQRHKLSAARPPATQAGCPEQQNPKHPIAQQRQAHTRTCSARQRAPVRHTRTLATEDGGTERTSRSEAAASTHVLAAPVSGRRCGPRARSSPRAAALSETAPQLSSGIIFQRARSPPEDGGPEQNSSTA